MFTLDLQRVKFVSIAWENVYAHTPQKVVLVWSPTHLEIIPV